MILLRIEYIKCWYSKLADHISIFDKAYMPRYNVAGDKLVLLSSILVADLLVSCSYIYLSTQ